MTHLHPIYHWLLCLGFALLADSALAAPCTVATQDCTELLSIGGGPSQIRIYRTYSPAVRNDAITRALIVVHGQGRDADVYFRHALASAFLAQALDNTVIISPRFASNHGSCHDTLSVNELNWNCAQSPEGWRVGGDTVDNNRISSFDVVDEILRKVASKEAFPNLKAVVVAGHSGGGQFVQRYEMTNQIHEALGVQVSYVVSNPSSYAYLDKLRPTRSAFASDYAAESPGYNPPLPRSPLAPFVEFPDARNCTTYDDWPYGLQKRAGYGAKVTEDQIKRQFASRPVTYLIGEFDILPVYGFDASCAAGAQGPTRLTRGLAYSNYVKERYAARHNTIVVPACGHNARCMFTADRASSLLFPKE